MVLWKQIQGLCNIYPEGAQLEHDTLTHKTRPRSRAAQQSLDADNPLSRSVARRSAPSRLAAVGGAAGEDTWTLLVRQPGSAKLGIKPPGSWAKQIVTVPVWASPSLSGQPGPSPPCRRWGREKGAPHRPSRRDARNRSTPHTPAAQPLPCLTARACGSPGPWVQTGPRLLPTLFAKTIPLPPA